MVGLYARSLLAKGFDDDEANVMACIEMGLQVYNTKVHLPSSSTTEFAHLDCQYQRGGIEVPAIQCFIATSPMKHDREDVFR